MVGWISKGWGAHAVSGWTDGGFNRQIHPWICRLPADDSFSSTNTRKPKHTPWVCPFSTSWSPFRIAHTHACKRIAQETKYKRHLPRKLQRHTVSNPSPEAVLGFQKTAIFLSVSEVWHLLLKAARRPSPSEPRHTKGRTQAFYSPWLGISFWLKGKCLFKGLSFDSNTSVWNRCLNMATVSCSNERAAALRLS